MPSADTVAFANSLEPDQNRYNVGPDLDPNCLSLCMIVFLKEFLKKGNFEKSQQTTTKVWKITQHAKRSKKECISDLA